MTKFLEIPFANVGFDPAVYNGWTARNARKQALQLAGDYIMDVIYPYASEEDVIIWEDSWIDWPRGLCMICVNTQYEELYEYV